MADADDFDVESLRRLLRGETCPQPAVPEKTARRAAPAPGKAAAKKPAAPAGKKPAPRKPTAGKPRAGGAGRAGR